MRIPTEQDIEIEANKSNGYLLYDKHIKAPIYSGGFIGGGRWMKRQLEPIIIDLEMENVKLKARIKETDLVLNELFRSMQRLSNTAKFLECDIKRLSNAQYIRSKYFDTKDCLRIERSDLNKNTELL